MSSSKPNIQSFMTLFDNFAFEDQNTILKSIFDRSSLNTKLDFLSSICGDLYGIENDGYYENIVYAKNEDEAEELILRCKDIREDKYRCELLITYVNVIRSLMENNSKTVDMIYDELKKLCEPTKHEIRTIMEAFTKQHDVCQDLYNMTKDKTDNEILKMDVAWHIFNKLYPTSIDDVPIANFAKFA
jgi:hypothetical protein